MFLQRYYVATIAKAFALSPRVTDIATKRIRTLPSIELAELIGIYIDITLLLFNRTTLNLLNKLFYDSLL
jgi:hypothetical protein